MTIFRDLFKLSKKLSKALLENKGLRDLEGSDLFSDEAKTHIKQHLSIEAIKENLELLNQIDKEADWKNVAEGISDSGKVKPIKRRSISTFMKVAAVVIPLVSLTYIVLNKGSQSTALEAQPIAITAGTDKSILTLDDGRAIFLNEKKQYENDVVKSDGERLTYTKANTSSKLAFNYLTVPRGGQYQIALSDGTLVWLNADSKLKYPVNFSDDEPRIVELVYGEAYFEVSPSTKHQGNHFKVLTQQQEVDVLGTEFNIKAYNDESYIFTTLVEGHITILIDETLEELIPTEQTQVNLRTNQMTKSIVNVDNHVAWVKGYFNFKDTSLQDIMKVLSRWYDVDISFSSDDLKDVRFSGLLNRKHNINTILNGIKNTQFINAYEIKNKTITIK
ncbi:FecR family protein [Winogradskyella forsetii]|uniref:FecR family protein n=1 Tax=Winogradskyella forsetii TaxID=2686077 RepID=UPI0015BE3ED5|nr:FecR family protein [Winogradskyella forsetii]